MRVGAQAVGFEILVAVMTDGDALFRTDAAGGGPRAGLGLAILGLDRFSRCGFGGGLPCAVLRAGDFFCAAVRAAARDVGFCLAMDVLPFGVVGKR